MIEFVQIMAILACMAGEAFFAGMETGVISIHRMRLKHYVRRGIAGARVLQGFLEDSDRLLGTTLVGTNICVVSVSVIAASLARSWAGEWGKAASTAVMAVLLLVFCEYIPKAWFYNRPLERTRRFAGILLAAEWAFRPLSRTVVWLTRWLVPGTEAAFGRPSKFVTREDLKILAREGEKHGVLSPRERAMIHSVFELAGKQAHEIMVPLSEVIFVDSDMPLREFLNKARKSGFTRMPVFDRKSESFSGIINVFYVLSSAHEDGERLVADCMRPALVLDERMPADEILPRMRRFRQPMGLVSGADGSIRGLVTTEDVLEEIVGEL